MARVSVSRAIADRIISEYLRGACATQIARRLTADGVPTVRSAPVWTRQAVQGVIRRGLPPEPDDVEMPKEFPIAPLQRWLDVRQMSWRDLERLGWQRSERTKKRGVVSWEIADKIAGILHVHPIDIWPTWYGDDFYDDEVGGRLAS